MGTFNRGSYVAAIGYDVRVTRRCRADDLGQAPEGPLEEIAGRTAVLGERLAGEEARLGASRDGISKGPGGPRAKGFEAVLVGGGAIGNAAAWALARTPDFGAVTIVDDETVELSNLQRYVMTDRSSVGHDKSTLLAGGFGKRFQSDPFVATWADFVRDRGAQHRRLILALDSAEDRKAAQASLPRWVANAWTQPGDLGVSEHSDFGGPGACVACLYQPDEVGLNEDEVVARALGVPDRLAQVRTLLHLGTGLEPEFLEAVAAALNRPVERLTPFAGQPIRDLYVRGICGGAVLPLGSTGPVRGELHVPLAHQSALAGVLLAARLIEAARSGRGPEITQLTTVDLLRPVPPMPSRPLRARPTCLCRDADYQAVSRAKWPPRAQPANPN